MSSLTVPVPASVRKHLDKNTHPGLQLDKYALSWSDQLPPEKLSEEVQTPAVQRVVELSRQVPDGLDFAGLKQRREALLDQLEARRIRAETSGPLTLHLSRASALENAGICLHPIYGFVYLPGTGIKGMARAYAETVWLPTQTDRHRAWELIEDVFGWGANRKRRERIEDPDHDAHRRFREDQELGASSGAIVFHDAWPEQWPPLRTDILNNHHRRYYQGDTENGSYPPGDWEEPNMVAFLTVPAGQAFQFSLGKQRFDTDEELLDLAESWIIGALERQGAGAKTNSGYGMFSATADPQKRDRAEAIWQAAEQQERRRERSLTMELTTPAFLGGQNPHEAEGCDLRSATLRGLLRWWWRTMHAAWLDVPTLRDLEATLWGDTSRGSSVQTVVERPRNCDALLFDRKQIIDRLQGQGRQKVGAGLAYHSFGMDDGGRHRYWLPPEASWPVRLVARPGRFAAYDLGPQMLLEQVEAALWLLSEFGGIGSKSRNGFGGVTLGSPVKLTLKQCQQRAAQFRQACGLQTPEDFLPAASPALETMLGPLEVTTPWRDPWFVLDRIGTVAQELAKSYSPKSARLALGLPREIRGGGPPFQLGPRVRESNRHASPLMYRVLLQQDGTYLVRIVAFPTPELPHDPSLKESGKFLEQARQYVAGSLRKHADQFADSGQAAQSRPKRGSRPPAVHGGFQPQQRITVTVTAFKTKGAGKKRRQTLRVVHEATGTPGSIVNSAEVPGELAQEGASFDAVVTAVLNDGQLNLSYLGQ